MMHPACTSLASTAADAAAATVQLLLLLRPLRPLLHYSPAFGPQYAYTPSTAT